MNLLAKGFAWLGLKGAFLLAAAVILSGWLVAEKLGHADTRSSLSTMTTLYEGEVAAHKLTVANYRTAAEKARREDAENKLRVETEQRATTERIERDYQARLADARARAERLRDQLEKARGHPGSPGTAPMPSVPDAPGRPDGASPDPGFSIADRLIATEQAIQLDALQQWIRQMSKVDRGLTTPASSRSPSAGTR